MVLLTTGLLLTVPLGSCALRRVPQQQVPVQTDIVGFYECQGMNADGTAYHGFAEIVRSQDTFRIGWTINGEFFLGIGILKGDVFAVSYFGGAPAVVLYKVDGNRLIGEWTMGGFDGRVYPDVLTKTDKRLPPPEPRERPPVKPEQREQPGIRV